jgi:hypothetical protein
MNLFNKIYLVGFFMLLVLTIGCVPHNPTVSKESLPQSATPTKQEWWKTWGVEFSPRVNKYRILWGEGIHGSIMYSTREEAEDVARRIVKTIEEEQSSDWEMVEWGPADRKDGKL